MFVAPATREVECKSILAKSGIPGVDFSLNPYVGCAHACAYCYAPCIVNRFRGRQDPWGSFVDVKVNAPARLRRALRRVNQEVILLSSVTDPYQPIERKTGLVRACLAEISTSSAQVSILTKSDLVARDMDILNAISGVEVGLSIATTDDDLARALEPGAPSPSRRFAALEKLSAAGLRTWVFIAPAIPGIGEFEEQLEPIYARAREAGASCVRLDPFNFYPPMTASLTAAIRRSTPERLARFREALSHKAEFASNVRTLAAELAARYGFDQE
ncbi:MAG: radical SAM protein [Firmicutes bacterium]|nr:radical SAM protein [Bacillota bacterium]MDH7496320.1 radical SAM protein [Bacillota bacterium]